jgi:inner membrane protein
MDPPTHGLLGAVIGQAFFARRLGRRALGWGALLNMLPDVDVVTIPALGGLAEWRYHRTATHSLPVLALGAIALGWLLWRWRGRREDARAWIGLAAVALLAHPLADAFTSYGTVLFWPWRRRFAWDAVAIVDVFFTGALLVALLLGWIWRGRARAAAAAAAGALAFLVLYDAYGLLLNARAQREARAQLVAQGRAPDDVHAYPVLLLPWLRRVVAREGAGHAVGWVSTWRPRPIEWYTLTSSSGPAVEAARRLPDVRMFEWFAMGQTRPLLQGSEGELAVEVEDLRYGFPNDPEHGLWGVRAVLEGEGEPARGVRRIQRRRPPGGALMRWLWGATFAGRAGLPAAAPAPRESR